MDHKNARSLRRKNARAKDTFRRPKPHRKHGEIYSHESARTDRDESKRDTLFHRSKAESRLCHHCGNIRKLCDCVYILDEFLYDKFHYVYVLNEFLNDDIFNEFLNDEFDEFLNDELDAENGFDVSVFGQ